LVINRIKQFKQQQGRPISSEDALVLLEEQQLLDQPELYCFLNQELRDVQVVYMLSTPQAANFSSSSSFRLCAFPAGQQRCTKVQLQLPVICPAYYQVGS
jgi:hypothetical protein